MPIKFCIMKIKLTKTGKSKLATVKLIREFSDLSLLDCKIIAETLNSVFQTNKPESYFLEIKQKFNKIGVEIELFDSSDKKTLFRSKNIKTKTYSIFLHSSGAKFIETVKIIKNNTNLSLKECEDITHNIPSSFAVKLSDDYLSELENQLVINNIDYDITEFSAVGIENKKTDSAPSSSDTTTSNDYITIKITILNTENSFLLINLFLSIFEISLWNSTKLLKGSGSVFYSTILESNIQFIEREFAKSKSEIEVIILDFDDSIPDDANFYKFKKIVN